MFVILVFAFAGHKTLLLKMIYTEQKSVINGVNKHCNCGVMQLCLPNGKMTATQEKVHDVNNTFFVLILIITLYGSFALWLLALRWLFIFRIDLQSINKHRKKQRNRNPFSQTQAPLSFTLTSLSSASDSRKSAIIT